MIADSSALPEQVTRDVIASAFNSAGQRCSALRLLFVQDSAADRIIAMIAGAMAELAVGDPALLATDIGPVIDGEAREKLEAHARRMDAEGRLVYACPLGEAHANGTFFAPRAYEIPSAGLLRGEVFGPILHIVRFPAGDAKASPRLSSKQAPSGAAALDEVADAINATGYGLTVSIHSRIEETVDRLRARLRVGNIYVNRNQIGAVVGAQPFGGEGLSGTGPKAGGPRYLARFAVERTVSVDTTASGGNAALLAAGE
jgi:RHH-type transcriptional regulator, proline utilization regulon repressor / proline dehydrogenase / delta 1-pyrroline-5-carboxylate dehydrogenase